VFRDELGQEPVVHGIVWITLRDNMVMVGLNIPFTRLSLHLGMDVHQSFILLRAKLADERSFFLRTGCRRPGVMNGGEFGSVSVSETFCFYFGNKLFLLKRILEVLTPALPPPIPSSARTRSRKNLPTSGNSG
jgi:hypothetical protein